MFGQNGVSLISLKKGQSGTIINISAGHGWADRLSALGIIPGKKITKVSSMLMRGPVTVQVDRINIALGHRMARRIIVKPD
jgi:ferrous iron transport protein A